MFLISSGLTTMLHFCSMLNKLLVWRIFPFFPCLSGVYPFFKAPLYFSCYRRLERRGGRPRAEGQGSPVPTALGGLSCWYLPEAVGMGQVWRWLFSTPSTCSHHTCSAVCLQVETHLCMIPILWSPQVLFGIFHRLRNLKPFPAGEEKDQNHLDLTLGSFHDKVKKPRRCCV